MAEPLRVLTHPGVIGGALVGEIERHLEVEASSGREEMVEVLERAEGRVDGGVASLLAPDRPGTAHIVGGGRERVVAPLAVRVPDRVHRRQVENVEGHGGDTGQGGFSLAERGASRRVCTA